VPADQSPSRDVDVVVVTYNSARHIGSCLESLDGNDRVASIVVVDNLSTDDSLTLIADRFPHVLVVRSGVNLGFGSAVNRGIAATSSESNRHHYVCILNPDAVAESRAIDTLANYLDQHPAVALVGPEVRNIDGSTYPSARSFPNPIVGFGHAFLGIVWPNNPASKRYRRTDPESPDWISGTAMLARRTALEQVSGFDERYFMYVEDLDLCWRLRKAKWGIGFCPAAVVRHEIGGSSGTDRAANRRLLFEHHRSTWLFVRRSTTGLSSVLLPFYAIALAARYVIRSRIAVEPPKNRQKNRDRG
jgi:N-acetylglucosaminyl-diphospho-decaprenol L-rhamnosyltransferase